jgi:hypothetical protein
MSVKRWNVADEGSIRSNRTGQELTLKLRIITDHVDDSLTVLKRDLPDFQKWQPHSTEDKFFVDEFSADQVTGSLIWNASVRYTDTITKNPLDLPVEISVRSETVPGATIFDRKRKLILNKAGDPPQPIDKPERIRVFVFEKNLPDLADWLYDFEDVTNSDAVTIRGKTREKRTLLFKKAEIGKKQTQDDVDFYPTLIELWYRKSGWLHRFPNVGFNELYEIEEPAGSGTFVTRKRPIAFPTGERPSEPQILDADGRWIQKPTPDDLVLLDAEIHEEVDFNRFPIK